MAVLMPISRNRWKKRDSFAGSLYALSPTHMIVRYSFQGRSSFVPAVATGDVDTTSNSMPSKQAFTAHEQLPNLAAKDKNHFQVSFLAFFILLNWNLFRISDFECSDIVRILDQARLGANPGALGKKRIIESMLR